MKSWTRPHVRYSICGLLAFVALLGVACFWVTWPKRVAETFVVDYFHELDSQNPFKEGTPEAAAFARSYRPRRRDLSLVSHHRSIMDILASRQTFDCENHEFTVTRGAVMSGPMPFFQSIHRYYR